MANNTGPGSSDSGSSRINASTQTSGSATMGNASSRGKASDTADRGGSTYRPEKIDEALRTIDNAISREGADLRELLTSDYQHLKSAIGEMAPKVTDAFRKASDETLRYARDVSDQGMKKGREIATEVDSQVRSNPWAVIGGVAVGALALGFLVGRSSESNDEEVRYIQSREMH